MNTQEEERKRQWRDKTESFLSSYVESPLLAQIENGLALFEAAASACEQAQQKIGEAQREIQKPLEEFNYATAQNAVRAAQKSLHEAIHAAPWCWRMQTLGGFYFLWYSGSIAASLATFFLLGADDDIDMLEIPTWALIFGVLGGALRGVWWLRRHTASYTLRRSWAVYMWAPPIAGAALGIIAYLLYQAGGLALSFDPADSRALAMVITFVGGYSWEWVNQWWGRLVSDTGTAA